MITLQFVCEDAISSKIIAWFGSGHFSHVDAVLDSGDLLGARSDKVGGKPAGVQIRPPDYAIFKTRAIMKIQASHLQSYRFYEFLNSQVGKPYDETAIWAFFTDRNWREPDSWICSELQAAAGEASGVLPKLALTPNKITPVACALAFSAIGGKES
jgi:uncharacterized protein YycO